jgi:hypothetical protein
MSKHPAEYIHLNFSSHNDQIQGFQQVRNIPKTAAGKLCDWRFGAELASSHCTAALEKLRLRANCGDGSRPGICQTPLSK